MKAMQKTTFHRICQVSGLLSAVALALLLVGTSSGRDALAWIYLQSTEAIPNTTHSHAVLLDRLDPTCPQYI